MKKENLPAPNPLREGTAQQENTPQEQAAPSMGMKM